MLISPIDNIIQREECKQIVTCEKKWNMLEHAWTYALKTNYQHFARCFHNEVDLYCFAFFSSESLETIENELNHPIIAPAIEADKSDTIVPANIALKPSSKSIGFILGAITPIPPI